MRLASSCTVMASGRMTSRTTFSRSPEWLAMPALVALLPALHRGHRALAPVLVGGVGDGQLARAAAIVVALAAGALLLDGRDLVGDLLRPDRAAGLDAGGGHLRGGRIDRRGLGVARLGGVGLLLHDPGGLRPPASAAAAAARCSAISFSRSGALGASFSARSRGELGLAGRRRLLLLLAALGLLGLRGLDRDAAPLELGVREARGRAGPRRAEVPAGAPGFGTMIRLRLCSTVTDLVRPWLKLWRTWLVSVPPLRRPSSLALAVAVLVVHHSVSSLSCGGLPPPVPNAVCVRRRRRLFHIPDARQPLGLVSHPVPEFTRQHGGMYHTITGECQTQFVPEKARNKAVFTLRRAKPGTFALRPVRRLQEQRRPSRDQRVLRLLEPRHRLPGLPGERQQLDHPRREQRPRPGSTRSGGTRTCRLAARAKCPFAAACASTLRSALTQMPRPGSRPARSGTISPSGATTKRISPAFGPVSRVTMQRRSGSSRSFTRPPRVTSGLLFLLVRGVPGLAFARSRSPGPPHRPSRAGRGPS